jgi:membrane-associated phospholipid phosphatase
MFNSLFLEFDSRVFVELLDAHTPFLDVFFKIVTNLGSVWIVGLIFLILVILNFKNIRRNWKLLFYIALNCLIIEAVIFALKYSINRGRPPSGMVGLAEETDPSFPSGHTLLATVFYSLVFAFLTLKYIRFRKLNLIICCVIILLVGYSRLYLGVHWFTDVIFSWIIGFSYFALNMAFFDRLDRKFHILPPEKNSKEENAGKLPHIPQNNDK